MGTGAARRLPPEGVPDDEDRRPIDARKPTRQLDESLRRLQTDCIDLVQHHEILRFEDPHRIFDERGRQSRAARSAAGGQDPLHRLHRPQGSRTSICYMLEVAREHGFQFDAVQMPLNVMDAHYRSFEQARAAGAGASRGSACSA